MSSFMRLIAFFALVVQLFTTTTAFTSVSKMHTAYRSYLSTTTTPKYNNNVIATTTSNSQLYMATATPTAPAPVKKREKKVSSDVTDDEKAKDRGWLVRLYNDVSYLCLHVLIEVWRIVLIYIANLICPLTPFIYLSITILISCAHK